MSTAEFMRLMEGLEALGLTTEETMRFMKWVESGKEEYKPKNIRGN